MVVSQITHSSFHSNWMSVESTNPLHKNSISQHTPTNHLHIPSKLFNHLLPSSWGVLSSITSITHNIIPPPSSLTSLTIINWCSLGFGHSYQFHNALIVGKVKTITDWMWKIMSKAIKRMKGVDVVMIDTIHYDFLLWWSFKHFALVETTLLKKEKGWKQFVWTELAFCCGIKSGWTPTIDYWWNL